MCTLSFFFSFFWLPQLNFPFLYVKKKVSSSLNTHTGTGKHTHFHLSIRPNLLTDWPSTKNTTFFLSFSHRTLEHAASKQRNYLPPFPSSFTQTYTHRQKKVCTLIPNQTRVLLVFYLCSWLDNGDWLTDRGRVSKKMRSKNDHFFFFSLFDVWLKRAGATCGVLCPAQQVVLRFLCVIFLSGLYWYSKVVVIIIIICCCCCSYGFVLMRIWRRKSFSSFTFSPFVSMRH